MLAHHLIVFKLMARVLLSKSPGGEGGGSPKEEDDDVAGDYDDPLDIFRNVDQTKFEWVNPEEIMAGGTTCGFLHAPLGTDSSVDYPAVKTCKC